MARLRSTRGTPSLEPPFPVGSLVALLLDAVKLASTVVVLGIVLVPVFVIMLSSLLIIVAVRILESRPSVAPGGAQPHTVNVPKLFAAQSSLFLQIFCSCGQQYSLVESKQIDAPQLERWFAQ
jgi:hypothetical protein